MYCCPKGGAFLRSIALKGWKSTKKTAVFGSSSKFRSSMFLYVRICRYAFCLQFEKCRSASMQAAVTVMLYMPFLPFLHWCKILLPRDFSIWTITRLPNLSCHAGITVAGTVGLSTISVSYPLFTSISWYCELVLLNFSSFFDRITKRYTFWQWIRQNTTTAFFHKFDTFLSKYIAF